MKEVIIFGKESLIESICADIITFLFLILCIWFSHAQGDGFWTFLTCLFFLFMLYSTFTKHKTPRLRCKKEAVAWANSLPED